MPRDRDDDEYDDEEYDRDDEDDGRDRRPLLRVAQLRRARKRVQGPAILLIVNAVLGLGVFGYNVVSGLLRDPLLNVKKQRAENDRNPQLNAQQRQLMNEMNESVQQGVKPFVPLFQMTIVLGGFLPLITIAGAVSMLRFSSVGLAKAGAIAAFLPCTGCCCLLGLGGGIWSFSAMSDRDVRKAFAAGGRVNSRRRDDD